MNAGLDSNLDVFTNLATALRQNSEPSACTLQFRFVEPGYYESFERLYRMASSAPDGEVENIQEYMKTVSQQLSAVAQVQVDAAASLLPVCIALHQELIQELARSEEHTSELQSLMRISYAVFCLKKKIQSKQKVETTP